MRRLEQLVQDGCTKSKKQDEKSIGIQVPFEYVVDLLFTPRAGNQVVDELDMFSFEETVSLLPQKFCEAFDGILRIRMHAMDCGDDERLDELLAPNHIFGRAFSSCDEVSPLYHAAHAFLVHPFGRWASVLNGISDYRGNLFAVLFDTPLKLSKYVGTITRPLNFLDQIAAKPKQSGDLGNSQSADELFCRRIMPKISDGNSLSLDKRARELAHAMIPSCPAVEKKLHQRRAKLPCYEIFLAFCNELHKPADETEEEFIGSILIERMRIRGQLDCEGEGAKKPHVDIAA